MGMDESLKVEIIGVGRTGGVLLQFNDRHIEMPPADALRFASKVLELATVGAAIASGIVQWGADQSRQFDEPDPAKVRVDPTERH